VRSPSGREISDCSARTIIRAGPARLSETCGNVCKRGLFSGPDSPQMELMDDARRQSTARLPVCRGVHGGGPESGDAMMQCPVCGCTKLKLGMVFSGEVACTFRDGAVVEVLDAAELDSYWDEQSSCQCLDCLWSGCV